MKMTDKEQPIPPKGEIALTLRSAWWTAHTEHGRMVSFKHPEHGWIGFTLSDGDALKLAALLLQGYAQ